MADILLNNRADVMGPSVWLQYVNSSAIYDDLALTLDISTASQCTASCTTNAATTQIVTADLDTLHLRTRLANAYTLSGVTFKQGDNTFYAKANSDVQRDLSPVTGVGTSVGTLTPGLGELTLNDWAAGSSPVVSEFRGAATPPSTGSGNPVRDYAVVFRTAAAPIRPSSLSVLGTLADGTTFNVSSDNNGVINATRVKGRINHTTGVVTLVFVTPSAPEGSQKSDLSFLGIAGITQEYLDTAQTETLRYNAVSYSYLPLAANVLGLDPVRLPSDGRVPIFRAGSVAVVHDTQRTSSAGVSNGQTIYVGRPRLSRVRVIGANGATITGGYSGDLNAGTVTFTDVSGYSQPVQIEHRIEDAALISDAQISGDLKFTRRLTHSYPAGAKVSSALLIGDMKARMAKVFDQQTFTGVWSDDLIGDPAGGTYDAINYPPLMSNEGAVTERFALVFSGATAFNIIGEHLGVIGVGTTGTVTEPINPASGTAYFRLPVGGWGTGWSAGNVLRLNTVGAIAPVWVARVVKQGDGTVAADQFALLVRGDVDAA